jgi:hypothetical protein
VCFRPRRRPRRHDPRAGGADLRVRLYREEATSRFNAFACRAIALNSSRYPFLS